MESLREASTVCLVRDTDLGLEVLMVRRTPLARFMGGAWVFPGGAVDEEDDHGRTTGPDRWHAAALRELNEETGIRLAEHDLAYFANWITPAPLPIRFDTRFFVAMVSTDLDPIVDGNELVDALWIRPADVLERAGAGSWLVAFPTRKIVEFLGSFDSTDRLGRHIDARAAIEPIQPRLSITNDRIDILMPDDPGFGAAAAGEQDPELMAKMMKIVADGGEVPPEFRPA